MKTYIITITHLKIKHHTEKIKYNQKTESIKKQKKVKVAIQGIQEARS